MKLLPTKHFKARIEERGITWAQCEETVRNPSRKRECGKGEAGGIRYIFEKDFADYTIIVVVGEKLPKTADVKGITAYRKER